MGREKTTVKKLGIRYEKKRRTIIRMMKDGRLPPAIDPKASPKEWYLDDVVAWERKRHVYI